MNIAQGLARLFFAAAFAAGGGASARAQADQQPGGVAPSPPGAAAPAQPGGPVVSNPEGIGPGVPRGDLAEVMVKSALMTFNDANLTGNYAVFSARLHPVFRQQAPAERLAGIFAAFRTNRINLGPVLVHRPVYTDGPRIDADGQLVAKGHLETRPWRTNFDLLWRRDGDAWWLWRINVHVKPPDQ